MRYLLNDFMPYPPVLPELYWNVESNEQRYLLICKNVSKIICYLEKLSEFSGKTAAEVKELRELFAKFQEHGFDDYYADQIEKWVNAHMTSIIERAIKNVFFGLTPDGYFVAYVPDSWDDIEFDTILNYSDANYGRLVLSY